MTTALEAILERPKTILTMMVVLILAGVGSFLSIPKEARPSIDIPVYYISAGQQGISPRDAVRLLVKPLETQLRGLEGLDEIISMASTGHAGIILKFDIDSNKDKVLANIRDKVDRARSNMPSESDNPSIFETNLSLQPTITVTLSGKVPERALYQRTRQLKDEIEAISSVQEATMSGHRKEILEVLLDPDKLKSYNINPTELLQAFRENNRLVPAGFLDDGKARFNLKVPALVETVQDIDSIVIRQNDEGLVRLGDVAKIRRTFKDASSYTRVNGKPAIAIDVVKRIGTNIIENNREVRRVVTNFIKEWPSTIHVDFLLDESGFIFEVFGSLQSAIITAIVLVLILVIASLGFRAGLLVGLAIPSSFMMGFLILSIFDVTVNMMVMFGMVLTVGILVDSAIVVTEYAERKMAEGMPPDQAYSRAARLMFWPVVASTATTLAAFLPLLFWPGIPGKFMSYLPIVVIIVLTASLLTALIFLPATGALFVRVFGRLSKFFTRLLMHQFPSWRQAAGSRKKEDGVAKMLSAQAQLDINQVPGLTGIYLRFLRFVTAGLIGNGLVILIILTVTITVFTLFPSRNAGVEFFIEEEPDVGIFFVSARGNLSVEQIRDLSIEVEQEILKIPGIENVIMTAHSSADGGRGSGGGKDKPNDIIATLQLEFSDYCCRTRAVEIFSEMRQRMENMAGIKIETRAIEGGPPTGKAVNFDIKSTNYDLLLTTVAKVRSYMDGIKNLQDIEDGRSLPGIDWELTVNRELAGRYNASISSVGTMVQLITNGVLIGKYRPDDSEDEVDVRVRFPKDQRTLDGLRQLRLRTVNGQVPISNFVTMKAQPKVSSIVRRDGLYAISIKANLVPGAKFGNRGLTPDDKITEISSWLDSQDWPKNIQFKFRGADEEQKKSSDFLLKAAAAALFLMFIILLTQFNSFYQTILTLSTIVLGIAGVLIGMMVTGQKFSIIMTGTGTVALAGIVVNNAIVLIDTYNRLRSEGIDIRQAILKTSAQRLRPIMLTTVTTILGLVPMALAININFFSKVIFVDAITSAWWVQLSTAIIFGLAFSTMLTLVLIPVMLSLPINLKQIVKPYLNNPSGTGRKLKDIELN